MHHIHLKTKKVGNTLKVSPGITEMALHLGISLTSRITFQKAEKIFLLSSGSFLCFWWILDPLLIPYRERFLQLPSVERDLPSGLHPAWFSQHVYEVSFPARSMATKTTKWNRAPDTHKSPTAQTACWATLHPAASRSTNVRELMSKFCLLESPTSLTGGLFFLMAAIWMGRK